jgi:hypothetical protein
MGCTDLGAGSATMPTLAAKGSDSNPSTVCTASAKRDRHCAHDDKCSSTAARSSAARAPSTYAASCSSSRCVSCRSSAFTVPPRA